MATPPGRTTHVNYEPSSRNGLVESQMSGTAHTPYVAGPVTRQAISRKNNYEQPGLRYRTIETWERDDLVHNLIGQLSTCNQDIKERMVGHLTQCDAEYGQRVAEGLGLRVADLAVTADD